MFSKLMFIFSFLIGILVGGVMNIRDVSGITISDIDDIRGIARFKYASSMSSGPPVRLSLTPLDTSVSFFFFGAIKGVVRSSVIMNLTNVTNNCTVNLCK